MFKQDIYAVPCAQLKNNAAGNPRKDSGGGWMITNAVLNPKYDDYSKEQIEQYTKIGGAPSLDGLYTVFGEIVEGMEETEEENEEEPEYDEHV